MEFDTRKDEIKLADEIYARLRALGFDGTQVTEAFLAGRAGSGRLYYRIVWGSQSRVVQISHAGDADFERFVRLGALFYNLGLATPRIDAVSFSAYQVLMEDLGNDLLLERVRRGMSRRLDYERVLNTLSIWQSVAEKAFARDQELLARRFDEKSLRWETEYFTRHCWESYLGLRLSNAMEIWFSDLARRVSSHPQTLMHRDFQSQNILFLGDAVRFVDYQGARCGSAYYDVASLLWDPYVSMDIAEIEELFRVWSARVTLFSSGDWEEHWTRFLDASAQRVMQALGAFCNLAQNKGLEFFARQIPRGLTQLRLLLATHPEKSAGAMEILEVLQGLSVCASRI